MFEDLWFIILLPFSIHVFKWHRTSYYKVTSYRIVHMQVNWRLRSQRWVEFPWQQSSTKSKFVYSYSNIVGCTLNRPTEWCTCTRYTRLMTLVPLEACTNTSIFMLFYVLTSLPNNDDVMIENNTLIALLCYSSNQDYGLATIEHCSPNLSYTCSYWDITDSDGRGHWSSEGCETYDVSKDVVTCHCFHLTNLSVLVVCWLTSFVYSLCVV